MRRFLLLLALAFVVVSVIAAVVGVDMSGPCIDRACGGR